ncbi:sensor histidine kinase [Embleya scabrispora]|uniref:sensor histidine kinase n=1 Tax=Embleya scabrispora TaxID=159449 RepID=UPI00035CF836|nr:sensor histidine kinase [Embleya scabrispora]MYS81082.1 histidine kinase [Streptomyces sp. SID5474]
MCETSTGVLDRRLPLSRRLRPRHWIAIDCAVALPVAGFDTPGLQQMRDVSMPVWAGTLFLVATALAIAVRRPFPWVALVLATGGALVLMAYAFPKSPLLGLALVVFLVGRAAADRAVVGAVAAVLGAIGLAAACAVSPMSLSVLRSDVFARLVPIAIALVAACVAGVATRKRQAYEAGLREQIERAAEARVEQARRTVVEERLRIAREMHDIVAHSMSLIAVQAELGGYIAAARPEEARPTLASIADTSRSAMVELRHLLGVLRAPDGDGPPVPADLRPSAGLADLDELIATTARAGVHVDLVVVGRARALSPGLDLSAYRIVQEALTNVVKHAETNRAKVVLTFGERELTIDTSDEGRGRAPSRDHAGHGVAGMRERVELCGGVLDAAPRPDRGFRVLARLPFEPLRVGHDAFAYRTIT